RGRNRTPPTVIHPRCASAPRRSASADVCAGSKPVARNRSPQTAPGTAGSSDATLNVPGSMFVSAWTTASAASSSGTACPPGADGGSGQRDRPHAAGDGVLHLWAAGGGEVDDGVAPVHHRGEIR